MRELTTNTVSVDNKRKRAASDAEDVPSGSEDELSDPEDNQPEDEMDFETPKSKPKPSRKGKGKIGGPPANKKPRTTKTTTKGPKTAGRKPRKGKAEGDAFDAAKITKETKIAADNPLFSTC